MLWCTPPAKTLSSAALPPSLRCAAKPQRFCRNRNFKGLVLGVLSRHQNLYCKSGIVASETICIADKQLQSADGATSGNRAGHPQCGQSAEDHDKNRWRLPDHHWYLVRDRAGCPVWPLRPQLLSWRGCASSRTEGPAQYCLCCARRQSVGMCPTWCLLADLLCTAEKCPTLTNMLVIIVGGIPIAMPTVLSVTLALGAFKLAKVPAASCASLPSTASRYHTYLPWQWQGSVGV